MLKRLDCSMEGHAATIEVQLEAEVSADGAWRQRVSRTGESIRYRDWMVRYSVEIGGELSVERTVGANEPFDEGQSVELFRDQDEVLTFDPSDNTVWCRW